MNRAGTTLALGQLEPGADLARNLEAIDRLADHAKAQGASALLLPEYASFLHGSRQEMAQAAARSGEVVAHLRETAASRGLWVLLGSLVVPGGDGRMLNRSLLFDAAGTQVAHYDKLHLFDATLPDGRRILESRGYSAGSEAIVAKTPWGRMGLSICYDLRFAQLYRALALAGATVIVVPSAFARATGRAHWHALLAARAIECGAYVLAPATCGDSPGDRATYGHTLALDPSGRILGELGDAPGCLVVTLDPDEPQRARERLPSLQHDRAFSVRLASSPDVLFRWSPCDHAPHP